MLVVARYNEDVSWTRNFRKKIIYNKGYSHTIPFDLRPYVVNLPNVGREAHTYLYHILTHYDNLDDVTIFTQAEFKDHEIPNVTHFKLLFENIEGYSKNYSDPPEAGNYRRYYDFTIDEWKGPIANKTQEKLGEWYERVFEEKFPESPFMYVSAIFSVDKKYIRNRSKEFYSKLLNELSYHNAPVEAHFMERSWIQLFKLPV